MRSPMIFLAERWRHGRAGSSARVTVPGNDDRTNPGRASDECFGSVIAEAVKIDQRWSAARGSSRLEGQAPCPLLGVPCDSITPLDGRYAPSPDHRSVGRIGPPQMSLCSTGPVASSRAPVHACPTGRQTPIVRPTAAYEPTASSKPRLPPLVHAQPHGCERRLLQQRFHSRSRRLDAVRAPTAFRSTTGFPAMGGAGLEQSTSCV
jgi:hypothetical protein